MYTGQSVPVMGLWPSLIFVYKVKTVSPVFPVWASSCPSAICWKDYPFSIKLPWQRSWKSIDRTYEFLLLDSVSFWSSLCLCLCQCLRALLSAAIEKVLRWAGENLPHVLLLHCLQLCFVLPVVYKISKPFYKICGSAVNFIVLTLPGK